MPRSKLTDEQKAQLRADYEAWQPYAPGAPSANDIAAKYGITRQTLYNLRRRWIAEDEAKRKNAAVSKEKGLHATIEFLATELAKARAENGVLQEELERLRSRPG